MPPILASLFRKKILITAITLLALYSVAGFLVLPFLVEHYLPRIAKEKFHLEASIGKVRVNPFLMRVELNDFNFRETDGRPLLSFRRAIVDLETASLVHRAWVIGELSFDGLAVSLDVQKNGRLNFAALGDTTPAAKPARQAKPSVAKISPSPVKEPEERPIPFLLQHIAIRDSALTYGDQRYATPADIGFSSIQIEMQNLGGLPQYANTFRATATSVDGGSLDWQGEEIGRAHV